MSPGRRGQPAHNKLNRTGLKYGRVTALFEIEPGRWFCECECGNTTNVLSTNLANYAKNNRGCRHCANRLDISGEYIGLLTAESQEGGIITGRHPLWTFRCDCGNTIQGTVREFHAQWLRSCGCHDNAHTSWSSMMARCYDEKNNRYSSYGGRGIKVCSRWHEFSNFLEDIGERPKRHNLGRRNCERSYFKGNCFWEHISLNCRDTANSGAPTKPGLLKGSKPRKV